MNTIIYFFLFLIISSATFLFFIKKKIFLNDLHLGPQRIHEKPTSRIGGMILYIFILIYLFITCYSQMKSLLVGIVCFIPIYIIGIKEDIYGNTSPSLRLSIILFSSFLFIVLTDIYFVFEIPLISKILNINYIQLIFLTLLISTIVNGTNIFDGSNGHTALIGIFYNVILVKVAYEIGIYEIIQYSIIIISLLTSFLIFNFPKGSIFLGDTGAYFVGWSLSVIILLILFFSKGNISELFFINILFYPLFETVFSFTRKILMKRSPFKPDSEHLNLLMISYLKKIGSTNFNNLNTFLLTPIWFFPNLVSMFFYNNGKILFLILVAQIIIYLLIYVCLRKDLKI